MMYRAVCVLLAALLTACSPSDEGASRPPPTSPTSPSPPTSPDPAPPTAPAARLQLSGRVLDENGNPVPGMLVEVDYASGGGDSTPPSTCPKQSGGKFCWLATTTNDRGEYFVEYAPRDWSEFGWGFGYVYAFLAGYDLDVQWVPIGSSSVVRDLRTRRTSRIPAGESIVVSVGPTSSLCTDLEDVFEMKSRCEVVVIESGVGVLHVEAVTAAGGPAPLMLWYSSGNYAGLITRPAPGALAIPVRGGTYRILVGIPEGAPSQQFNVTTTLR